MKKSISVLALTAASLLLAACGDSAGTGNASSAAPKLSTEETAAAKKVSDGYLVDTDGATQVEADCVGAQMVKSLGVKRTNEIDWAADDVNLTEAEAGKVYDGFAKCVDLKAEMVEAMVGEDLSEKSAKCLAGELPDADIRKIMIASFTGGDPVAAGASLQQTVVKAAAKCLTADELKAAGF